MTKKTISVLLAFCLLFTLLPSFGMEFGGAASYAASYSSSQYPYGLAPVSNNTDLSNAFNHWKSTYITSNGAGGYSRVIRDFDSSGNPGATCSEGIGYGMLISVYLNEKDLFDNLWRYAKLHHNTKGLMIWQIEADGSVQSWVDNSAAPDGDEDMAAALIFADKKWGSGGTINYAQDARNVISALKTYCFESGTNIMKGGEGWGGSDMTDPSYYATAFWRIFADFTNDNTWYDRISAAHQVMDNVYNYNNNTGLMPDWCKSNGTATQAFIDDPEIGYRSYHGKADAFRYMWRQATDYCWFGTAKAKKYCDDLAVFWRSVGPDRVGSSYKITGEALYPDYNDSREVSMAATVMLTQGSTSDRDAWYNRTVIRGVDKDSSGNEYKDYYRHTLRVLSLMFQTGNFPNLYSSSNPTPTPTPSATPTPSETQVKLFAKSNNLYVTAPGTNQLAAVASNAASNEQFEKVYNADGTVSFKAANGKYVCANNDDGGKLYAYSDSIGDWEKFNVIENNDGTVSFKANSNGKYVCANKDDGGKLYAYSDSIGDWEKFEFRTN